MWLIDSLILSKIKNLASISHNDTSYIQVYLVGLYSNWDPFEYKVKLTNIWKGKTVPEQTCPEKIRLHGEPTLLYMINQPPSHIAFLISLTLNPLKIPTLHLQPYLTTHMYGHNLDKIVPLT